MRNEIKDQLTTLQIEAKETRKKKAYNIITIIAIALIFYLISYLEPQLNAFFLLLFIIAALLGGYYVIVNAIPSLVQPLPQTSYAFKKMAHAIDVLENSKSQLAYKEAYSCLKQAQKILNDIELDELEWYEDVNQTVKQFIENLQLVVLPATEKSKIRTEDLEEIAIALASMNPSKMEETNKNLETNPTYAKIKQPKKKAETFLKKIGENRHIGLLLSNKPVRFLLSNLFSFFVILAAILIQSFASHTNFWDSLSNTTNFLAFLGIVIMLGIGIYSITKRAQKQKAMS